MTSDENHSREHRDDAAAHQIVIDLLEQTRTALKTRDFPRFAPCFALPYKVETFEGMQVVENRHALEKLFLNSIEHYAQIGVTDMIRKPLESTFRDSATVTTIYETQLVHFDTTFQREPYVAFVEIPWVQGAWRCSTTKYAIIDSPLHGKTLLDKG